MRAFFAWILIDIRIIDECNHQFQRWKLIDEIFENISIEVIVMAISGIVAV
jgi:uncharacterized membrane protein YbhN (UPF0104 family)